MAWTISYTETAKKQLRKLDRQTARRILCEIRDGILRVLVVDIGHRRDIYR